MKILVRGCPVVGRAAPFRPSCGALRHACSVWHWQRIRDSNSRVVALNALSKCSLGGSAETESFLNWDGVCGGSALEPRRTGVNETRVLGVLGQSGCPGVE
jgi:hypothetical protein